jgi:hypothetical protein
MSANVEDMLGNTAGARHFLDEAEAIAAEADAYVATIDSSMRKLFTPPSKGT